MKLGKIEFSEQSEKLEQAESKEGLRDTRVESRESFRDKGIWGSFACMVAEVVTIFENLEVECAFFFLLGH